MPSQRLLYLSGVSPFRRPKGTSSYTDGITVNKTTQTVESAAVVGAFHIEDVYPLIDGGRFPVMRIAGERVEVWSDIYRDGHDVVSQPRPDLTRSRLFPLMADRPRARNGAWYEMVPRSQGKTPGQHGTFRDCIARLPDIAGLGFDVVYLTPIHPIGRTNRKGRNNAVTAAEGDPGSP